MTACAYRSLEPVLQQRIAELRERRERDALFVDVARGVAARRIGRALGSGAAVVLGAGALLLGLMGLACDSSLQRWMCGLATALLLGAWPAAFLVRTLGRALLRPVLLRDAHLSLSGDPGADLAHLEATDPLRSACDVAMRWERASTALPLAAMSLLAPLTLHAIVWLVLAHPSPDDIPRSFQDFGVWIGLSALIVGHSHLAVLVCSVRWGRRLRSVPTADLLLGSNRRWGVPLLWAAGLACLPGLLLVAVPPVLTLVTGMLFIPLMYWWTVHTVQRERVALDHG